MSKKEESFLKKGFYLLIIPAIACFAILAFYYIQIK